MKKILSLIFVFNLILFLDSALSIGKVRIKDIAKVQGISDNQIIGYGLVVGLSATGDTKNAYSTIQSVANMLRNFGIRVTPEQINKIRNVAAVMVTASLPAFAKSGDKIDVMVSSIGDATSLEGGVLLLTPLIGADNEVYATAQGSVSIGGFNIKGGRNVQVQRNHPLTGRILGGGVVTKNIDTPLLRDGIVNLILDKSDFTTALNIATVINNNFRMNLAKAVDPSRVEIKLLDEYKENLIEIISVIEELTIVPDTKATIVINERTGTVVIGNSVKISPVAITHGNLSITIKEPDTSNLKTAVKKFEGEEQRVLIMPGGNTIEDIVKALNKIGVTPRDLIAILQAIYQAGAIQAEIKII